MSNRHAFRDLRAHVPHRDDCEVGAGTIGAPSDEPFPGYDDLTVTQLRVAFHRLTQAELDACADYERHHLNREAVLTKLRYLHVAQPWPGYDSMGESEIIERLRQADLKTITRVRNYERRFGRRPHIHGAALHMQRDLLGQDASQTASADPRGLASHAGV